MNWAYRIDLKKTSNKGNVSEDVSFITDEQMITRHSNPQDSFKAYMEKRQKGEEVEWKRGVLKETFKDKTADEIKEHVEQELTILKEKLKKEIEVEWKITKIK